MRIGRGRPPQVRAAGDSALLVELEAVIDADVNARAIAIAGAIRAADVPGVHDVVPAYRSVAVYFDPLATDRRALSAAIADAGRAAPQPAAGALLEIPVAYGGDAGADLQEVADWARLTTEQVIERHAGRTYRVYMLGFLPGFAYMGSVDGTIAAPRRPTPRLRVPAGAVGIAGHQTGIYPRESPGGWQLIGRTTEPLFDAARARPSLFAPGDSVRFVREASLYGSPGKAESFAPQLTSPQRTSRRITVLSPGLFTTVQDLGRRGHQAEGVPVAGPMDLVSHRLANVLVGNPPGAALLEATLGGPELRLEAPVTVAVTGADLDASIDGVPLHVNASRGCAAGAVLRFAGRRTGARAYVAFDGGLSVPLVLGSRATHPGSGMGGIDGRALRAGDTIGLGASHHTNPRGMRQPRPLPAGGARLRVLPGPQDDAFEAGLGATALDALQRIRFIVSPQSDRMGYRLAGEPLPPPQREMISDATFAGGIQVPPSGVPILLMADRQTTGGYPQLATVITADLPLAGQLAPGDWIEFTVCSQDEALAALVEQERDLRAIG